MKRIAMLAGLILSTAAFADNNGNGGALRVRLIGFEEVPAVNSDASGDFQARVSRDGQSVDWTLTYSGLQAPVLQSHIHFAQKSVNGSIIVWLCGTATNPGPAGTQTCPGQAGTLSGTFTSANVLAGATASQQFNAGDLDSIVDAMRAGIAYANIHTTLSPGGEIRGQFGGRGRDD